MKIGIVLSNPPEYSETFFTSKIKGLQANRMEVVLFVQKNDSEFSLCETKVAPKVYGNFIKQSLSFLGVFISLLPFLKSVLTFIKLEKEAGSSILAILKKIYLNSHILRHKVDWLHFGFATQALGSELVAKAIGAKMAVSFRGFDINVYPLKHPNCYAKVWQNVDKVHSISNYLLEKTYGLGLSKLVPYSIITPAVDFVKINKSPISNPQSPISNTLPIIVTIARLNWIKGIDVAINAMKILKEKEIDFEYHIIGSGIGKDEERYKFQVYELGLTKNVFFQGKLSHIKTLDFLKDASLYIQPSYNEGFCNAVLEAQAFGKLCVVSNTGGLPENIHNNKTGWLVPKNNAEALANKLIEVIHLPEAEKQQISENAKQRVKELFTIEQQQEKFVEFYKN